MTRREYERALARLIPELEDETLAAYAEIAGASRRRVETAIATGDAEAVIRLLGIDEGAAEGTFAALLEALRDAFVLGGAAQLARLSLAAQRLQGVDIAPLHFDVRGDRAAAYLQANDASLAQGLADTARQRVREVVTQGIQSGLSPAQIARQLPTIALTEPQVGSLGQARQELGDANTPPSRGYLQRKGRDKRFDRIVARAIRDGKPLSSRERKAITKGYETQLRKQRAAAIARTEITRALNAGRYEAVMQAVDAGLQGIVLTWYSQRDILVRDIHVAMHGQQRRPGSPFNSPLGTLLRFPGDVSLGATAQDVMRCRCFFDVGIPTGA